MKYYGFAPSSIDALISELNRIAPELRLVCSTDLEILAAGDSTYRFATQEEVHSFLLGLFFSITDWDATYLLAAQRFSR